MKSPPRGYNPKTLALLERLKARCKACGGTGVSTRGFQCYPCLTRRSNEATS